jgi:hypothetical protein
MMESRNSRRSRFQERLSVTLPHTAPENANLVFALNEEIALFNPTTLAETNTEIKNTLPTVNVIKDEKIYEQLCKSKNWKGIKMKTRETKEIEVKPMRLSFLPIEGPSDGLRKSRLNPALMFAL